MTNALSAFGLNPSLLKSFGLNGDNATQLFGTENVREFVQSYIGAADDTFYYQYNAGDLFQTVLDATPSQNPIQGSGLMTPTEIAHYINNALQENLGVTLNDVNISFDGSGNITTSIDGVGTSTVNLADLLDQAGSQAGLGDNLSDLFF